MKKHAHVTVKRPPVQMAAIIVDPPIPARRGFHRVEKARVQALVKVVKIGSEYFLSDDISEPGVEPLFLLNTVSKAHLSSCYLTDNKTIWHVVEFWHHTHPALCSLKVPLIDDLIWKVEDSSNTYWEVDQDDIDKIQDIIKRYAEGLE